MSSFSSTVQKLEEKEKVTSTGIEETATVIVMDEAEASNESGPGEKIPTTSAVVENNKVLPAQTEKSKNEVSVPSASCSTPTTAAVRKWSARGAERGFTEVIKGVHIRNTRLLSVDPAEANDEHSEEAGSVTETIKTNVQNKEKEDGLTDGEEGSGSTPVQVVKRGRGRPPKFEPRTRSHTRRRRVTNDEDYIPLITIDSDSDESTVSSVQSLNPKPGAKSNVTQSAVSRPRTRLSIDRAKANSTEVPRFTRLSLRTMSLSPMARPRSGMQLRNSPLVKPSLPGQLSTPSLGRGPRKALFPDAAVVGSPKSPKPGPSSSKMNPLSSGRSREGKRLPLRSSANHRRATLPVLPEQGEDNNIPLTPIPVKGKVDKATSPVTLFPLTPTPGTSQALRSEIGMSNEASSQTDQVQLKDTGTPAKKRKLNQGMRAEATRLWEEMELYNGRPSHSSQERKFKTMRKFLASSDSFDSETNEDGDPRRSPALLDAVVEPSQLEQMEETEDVSAGKVGNTNDGSDDGNSPIGNSTAVDEEEQTLSDEKQNDQQNIKVKVGLGEQGQISSTWRYLDMFGIVKILFRGRRQ